MTPSARQMRTAWIHTPARRARARCCAESVHCRHSAPCSARANRDFRPAARAHRRAVWTPASGAVPGRRPLVLTVRQHPDILAAAAALRRYDIDGALRSDARQPAGQHAKSSPGCNRVDTDGECPRCKVRRAVRAPHRRLRQCDMLLRHVRVGTGLQPPHEGCGVPRL